jgi:hypothetical protein
MEPLKPGQVKITFPKKPHLEQPKPLGYPPGQHSGSILAPLVCALIALLLFGLGGTGGGGGGGGGGTYSGIASGGPSSSYQRTLVPVRFGLGTVSLPRKPVLEGKYAAFIRRVSNKDVGALVFTYANIQIKVVSSIPPDEDAISYPAEYGKPTVDDLVQLYRKNKTSSELDVEMLRLRLEALRGRGAPVPSDTSTMASVLQNEFDLGRPKISVQQKLSPYIIQDDVDVEIGPLVSQDLLVTHLRMERGDLKAASIDIIEGAPRGPPTPDEFLNRPVRTIYVLGRVRRVSGAKQKDRSVLLASVVDLGPTTEQLDKYIDESNAWQAEIKSTLDGYQVSDDVLWSPQAERGLTLAEAGHPSHPFPPHPTKPVYHPPPHPALEDHPVEHPFHPVP